MVSNILLLKNFRNVNSISGHGNFVYFEVNSVSETLVATIAMIAEVLFIAMQITVLYPLINRS